MKCLCNVRCRLIKDIDMFGKEPELYYKTRPKKTSWIGRILSFSFVFIYFAFFIYKFIKMLRRVDVTFYDTFTYASSPPIVPITHENFYIAFALEDPNSYDPFINEGVYYPKAFFKRAEMKGEQFDWQVVPLEVEKCNLNKFGKNYQNLYKNIDLDNYYCFKDINNFNLEGHFSYLQYSFFYIEFFPCVNNSNITDGNKCEPKEIIEYYLDNTFVSLEMEDIELTPKNFEKPIRERNVDVYTTVGAKLFEELHVFFEVVNIETDMDWFGFDEFENIKSQIYLKYDETFIMSNIIQKDVYKTGEKFADVTIKLSENMRTQRRVYTKFVTILGDVGGFMEVIFTLFRIISSFSVDILYEVSMVNRLFNFDLNKKNVVLKEITDIEDDKTATFSKKKRKREKEKEKDSENEKNPDQNDINIINPRKRTHRKTTKSLTQKKSIYNYNLNDLNNMNLSSSKSKAYIPDDADLDNKKTVFENSKVDSSYNEKSLVKKVRMNRACIYLWFCFVRRRRITENVLLNEGMDLISKRLDIFNIFEKIYKAEQRNEPLTNKVFSMSNECKTALKIMELETSQENSNNEYI